MESPWELRLCPGSGIIAAWSRLLPKKPSLSEEGVHFQEKVFQRRLGASRAIAGVSGCPPEGGALGAAALGTPGSRELREGCVPPLQRARSHAGLGKILTSVGPGVPDAGKRVRRTWMATEDSHFPGCETGCS